MKIIMLIIIAPFIASFIIFGAMYIFGKRARAALEQIKQGE